MSSIADALKRAQQERHRLHPSAPADPAAPESPNANTGASLAAFVLRRNAPETRAPAPVQAPAPPPPSPAAAPKPAVSPETLETDSLDTPLLSPLAPVAAPVASPPPPPPTLETPAPKIENIALTTALRQAPPSTPTPVRHEQRTTETIVEDYTSKRRLQLPESIVVYHDRAGVVAEQYRKIRDSLMAANTRRDPQALVLTSTRAGEGKTTTTLNLALSLAEIRINKVLLVDGSLQSTSRPSLSSLLRVPAESGLAEALSAAPTDPLEPFLKATPWHNLHLLPAGAPTAPEAASALLQSPHLRTLLRRLRGSFDWILIDAPPASTHPDAGLLAAPSDGILFVLALHRTAQEKAQSTIRRLRSMNLTVKSCILTRA